MTTERLELLAPAGDLEKFKTAVTYGADAVYFGGEIGGLRAGAGNLTIDEIAEALGISHSSVSCRLKRGREKLKNLLEGRELDESEDYAD